VTVRLTTWRLSCCATEKLTAQLLISPDFDPSSELAPTQPACRVLSLIRCCFNFIYIILWATIRESCCMGISNLNIYFYIIFVCVCVSV